MGFDAGHGLFDRQTMTMPYPQSQSRELRIRVVRWCDGCRIWPELFRQQDLLQNLGRQVVEGSFLFANLPVAVVGIPPLDQTFQTDHLRSADTGALIGPAAVARLPRQQTYR